MEVTRKEALTSVAKMAAQELARLCPEMDDAYVLLITVSKEDHLNMMSNVDPKETEGVLRACLKSSMMGSGEFIRDT